VAGCAYGSHGRTLLSWSYDGTVRLWDVATAAPLHTFAGHGDRVLAGAASHSAPWAASGARDGHVKLWNLEQGADAGTLILDAEVRGCFFLASDTILATVEANGRVRLHSIPELDNEIELDTGLTVECAALAPTGDRLALGTTDGRLAFIAIDGFENVPLFVTARQTPRVTTTRLRRFFRRNQATHVYLCTCPACRQQVEMNHAVPEQTATCPHCRRPLRVRSVVALQPIGS
jgi:WD40 repeat protein